MKNIKSYQKFLNESTNLDSLFLGKKISDIIDLIPNLKYENISGVFNKTVVAMDSFISNNDAEKYLTSNQYSIGRTQGTSPKGIILGDYDVQKWRNLDKEDQNKLDGILIEIDNEIYVLYFNFPEH